MKKKNFFIFTLIFLVSCGLVIGQDFKPKPTKSSITVTIPSGGSTWYKGSSYIIFWSRTGLMHKDVKITLSKPGLTALERIIKKPTANDGKYVWTITGDIPAGSYVVRVKTMDNLITDDSNVFIIKPKPLKFSKPFISKVLAMNKEGFFATPGGELHIKGSYFGPVKGKVYLYGLNKGLLPGLLKITKWDGKKNYIMGTLPNNISGIKDKTFQIQVKNIIGLSNKKNCGFRAKRITKILRWNDPVVRCIDKKTDGNYDFYFPPANPSASSITVPGTIGGYHKNPGVIDGVFSGDDTGYEQFEIKLKNGWRINDGKFVYQKLTSSSEKLTGPSPQPVCGPTGGDTEWRPKFTWKVTQGDSILYLYRVIIIGPIGVPYK